MSCRSISLPYEFYLTLHGSGKAGSGYFLTLRFPGFFNDINYLIENRDKIRGVIITHAHEDHMGGLSFLLREINIPVYSTELTLALAAGRLREYQLLGRAELNTITVDQSLELGCFTIEFSYKYIEASI